MRIVISVHSSCSGDARLTPENEQGCSGEDRRYGETFVERERAKKRPQVCLHGFVTGEEGGRRGGETAPPGEQQFNYLIDRVTY